MVLNWWPLLRDSSYYSMTVIVLISVSGAYFDQYVKFSHSKGLVVDHDADTGFLEWSIEILKGIMVLKTSALACILICLQEIVICILSIDDLVNRETNVFLLKYRHLHW